MRPSADVDADGVEQIPEALDIGAVAGCGPAAVESVPATTRMPQAPARTSPTSCSQRGAGDSMRPRGVPPRLDRNDRRGGEDDEREEKVRRHHQRMQVEPDRQQPERSLRDRAQKGEPSDPSHPAAETGVR